jgi:hypothetical protein
MMSSLPITSPTYLSYSFIIFQYCGILPLSLMRFVMFLQNNQYNHITYPEDIYCQYSLARNNNKQY